MTDPLFLEALDYNAIEVRQLITACLTGGVVGSGDLEVTAGAGTTVDVAAGLAVVPGTDNAGQGSYLVHVDVDQEGIVVGAAPGSDSRIDVVYVKVRDDTEDSGGNDDWVIDVEPGTPGADPDPPAIPDTAVALAHVLVTTGDTSAAEYTITDVRTFAAPATLPNRLQSGSGTTGGFGSDFTATFDPAFAEAPIVVAQAIGESGARLAQVYDITETGFSVRVINSTDGSTYDAALVHWQATAATQ